MNDFNSSQICIGKIYRHFKGNYYFIENVGYDSETSERMVIYKPVYNRDDDFSIWIRPEKMFFEKIDINRPDNITGQELRFKLCTELSKNHLA